MMISNFVIIYETITLHRSLNHSIKNKTKIEEKKEQRGENTFMFRGINRKQKEWLRWIVRTIHLSNFVLSRNMYCDEASILPSSPLAPLFAHRALRNRDAQKQLATGYFKYIRSYLSETNAIRTERFYFSSNATNEINKCSRWNLFDSRYNRVRLNKVIYISKYLYENVELHRVEANSKIFIGSRSEFTTYHFYP